MAEEQYQMISTKCPKLNETKGTWIRQSPLEILVRLKFPDLIPDAVICPNYHEDNNYTHPRCTKENFCIYGKVSEIKIKQVKKFGKK